MYSSVIGILLIAASVSDANTGQIFADEDEYTAPRSATIGTSGATSIRVEARAGTLRIEGREGITEARASGTARASSRSLLEDIKLVAEREGNEVVIRVEIPEMNGGRGWNRMAALDLLIEVPTTIALDVSDSSGDAEVRGVASLDIEDSSGNLHVEKIAGPVRIHDSSGDITVRDSPGEVVIDDSSGGIDVREVGTLTIERDSSGEIEASRVTGAVIVRSDGSGGIDVDDVGGDFTVRKDGSGGISYSNVKGTVDIPRRKR